MRRALVLFLLFSVLAPEVQARLLNQDAERRFFARDLWEIQDKRFTNPSVYSRFPRLERKLGISPSGYDEPLDSVYSCARGLVYRVQSGDTLGKIARRFGTTIELIRTLNGIKGSHLTVGQRLRLPDQLFTIRIDKLLNRLYLESEGVLIKDYPVSTGRSGAQTPEGVFFVQSRYPYPAWFHKGVVVPGGAPDNYLGTRWLGFDKPQFGIHGTIFPELIGQSVSKGCVRMRNRDIEELYEFIAPGTPVIITAE
jgi:lipoprotein-anchoring transpeptidase ErfK/SrfK